MIAEEDSDGEKILEQTDAKPFLRRVEGTEEDAPNEFIDEDAKQRRNWFLNRLNFDETDKLVLDNVAKQESVAAEDDYDPNEMFSEFKFRSFKKDRQIKQDYSLIEV